MTPRPCASSVPRSPNFNGDPDPVYSPDGSLLLLADNGSPPAIDVLDAHTFRRVARLPFDRRWLNTLAADNSAESLFMSPDGRTVYYAYAVTSPSGRPGPGYLDRWALPSGRLLSSSRVSTRGLVAIRLVDNGTRLVVLGDTAAQTLDARTLAPQRTVAVNLPAQLGVLGEATCCLESVAAINPDGTSAAVGSPDGTISFIDLSTGAIHPAAGGHTANVQSVRYSPNGRMLVSTADDGKVIVWDPKTAQPLQTLLGHAGRPTQSAFSADGRTLYTSSLDGTVLEWDLGSQRRFGRPFTTGALAPTPSPTAPLTPPLAISPDGSQFAARTAASTVGIFSLDTLQRQTSLTVPRAATITALAWSPAGSELAVGADRGLLQLWDVSGAPHLVRALSMPRPASHFLEAIQSVAFSADDRLIAASDAHPALRSFPARRQEHRDLAHPHRRTSHPSSQACGPGQRRHLLPRRPPARGRTRRWPGADPRLLKRNADPHNSPATRATTAAPPASPSPRTGRSQREPTPASSSSGTRQPALPSATPYSPPQHQ